MKSQSEIEEELNKFEPSGEKPGNWFDGWAAALAWVLG